MTDIDIQIEQLESDLKLIEKSKKELKAKLEMYLSLKDDLSNLSKRDTELPPGFGIHWFHRHDPFDSHYVLYLHGDTYIDGNDKKPSEQQVIELRLSAWEAWDFACKVLKPFIENETKYSS